MLGRRVAREAWAPDGSGLAERVAWDGDVPTERRRWERAADHATPPPTSTGGVAVRTYAFEGFEPVALLDGEGGAAVIECDQVGQPRLAVDRAGALVWEGAFDAWGGAVETSGEVEVDLRFPGQVEDRETGLRYNRHRYYDPEARIYNRTDPVGLLGGTTPHGYVPSPTLWYDPYGLDKVYRNLRPDENPDLGLSARRPGRGMTPAGHVMNGSKDTFRGSQFISTTRDPKVADQWRQPGQRTVMIDTDLLQPDSAGNLKVYDISTSERAAAHGLKGRPKGYAVASREVLLEAAVPPEAITDVTPGRARAPKCR